MAKPGTERINRKAISEPLLADRLGLNEPWIERWEVGGTWREESSAPAQLPKFITNDLNKREVGEVQHRIDQLVAAGCQRVVVYFCLQQLSPASEWLRSGGLHKGVQARPGEELVTHKQKKPIATREDMASVAGSARAARKQIHTHKPELSLMADASRIALPVGISTVPDSLEEALLLLEASLSWVAKLADAYTAPMETTLMKSKGLLYLTLYVSEHANKKNLRSPKISSVIKDSRKASDSARARCTVEAPGNALAELISKVSMDEWSIADLKEKLASFKQDHPHLYKILKQRLAEMHELASR